MNPVAMKVTVATPLLTVTSSIFSAFMAPPRARAKNRKLACERLKRFLNHERGTKLQSGVRFLEAQEIRH
jgi:hypothetical protein